ncbi:hypothetical protein XELAEV_18028110mg [Xenopus laevis]|uniref:Uncharacterized protein n=1 Tax=Xenopus laevis TaxID=8355 RepID=A0A974CWS3_XENLA|nr:hypothetical protein XELAEV_18028110mg [Xenopus laevis]
MNCTASSASSASNRQSRGLSTAARWNAVEAVEEVPVTWGFIRWRVRVRKVRIVARCKGGAHPLAGDKTAVSWRPMEMTLIQ